MKQLTLMVRILLIVALLAAGSVTFVHPTPTMAAVNLVQYGQGFSFWIEINGTDLQAAKVSATAALGCATRAASQIVARYFWNVTSLTQLQGILKIFGISLAPVAGVATATTLLIAGFTAKIYSLIRSYAQYATNSLYIVVYGGFYGPTPAVWWVQWK